MTDYLVMTDNDLKHDPESNPGPIDADRAFTIAELVIYRYRDQNAWVNTPEYDLLTKVATKLYKIAQTWKGPPTHE